MTHGRPSDGVQGELSRDADLDWTVVSSLLTADYLTNCALEEHLLRIYYDGSDEFDERRHIDETIDRHAEIIEQLELAKSLLEAEQDGEGHHTHANE